MPEVEFLLAGDGPLRQELEQEARTLGLRDAVVFLGDRRDIPAVHASMDVALLTSDSESLSNVILEAMAAGLPVVAYQSGGNPELINEQRGALAAPGNEAEFSDAVGRLLKQPLLRERLDTMPVSSSKGLWPGTGAESLSGTLRDSATEEGCGGPLRR